MDQSPSSLELNEKLRTEVIRDIVLTQMAETLTEKETTQPQHVSIPRQLIRYWHDPENLPSDVRTCLESWDCLTDFGFQLHLFDDESAAAYIREHYGDRESAAFARCGHPAMRCDYLRMCFILAEGGLYVDADDVLLGDAWTEIFRDGRLKLQPLCYDISAGSMAPAEDIWRQDITTEDRVFYVNNDPIASPPDHPVLQRALGTATAKLLDTGHDLEIQSTTGPGNLTTALAIHAQQLSLAGLPFDFELIRNWDQIAEMRWDLSYRGDERNWRNVYGC
jgi:hypothetical protein